MSRVVKGCRDCGKVLYFVNHQKKSCSACLRERRRKYQKEYYKKNPKPHREASKRWAIKHFGSVANCFEASKTKKACKEIHKRHEEVRYEKDGESLFNDLDFVERYTGIMCPVLKGKKDETNL